MPSGPPSRPKPDCLMPPNGAAGVRDHALVEADHPGLEPLDHAQRALEVARVDVGDEAVLGVVGRGDRLVLVGEALDRRHRPEDLLVEQLGVVGDVGEHGGVVEVAGAVAGVAADDRLGAAADGVLDELGDLAALAVVDQRPDLRRRPRCRARPSSRPSSRRASRRTGRRPSRRRGSGWRTCTPRRCCASSRSSRPGPRRRCRRRRTR